MSKTLICLLCCSCLHTAMAHAELPANERAAYIQSFLTRCHAQQLADPLSQDRLAHGLLTKNQLAAFCQCGAVQSANALDTGILEAFAKKRNTQVMLDIMNQTTQYCSRIHLAVGR